LKEFEREQKEMFEQESSKNITEEQEQALLKKSPELCLYIKNNKRCPIKDCSRGHSQDEVSLINDLKQKKLEREKKEAEEKRLAEEQMNEYKLLER
jgi:hypothetical protein